MRNILFVSLVALLFSACTTGFEELNTNTNQPETVTGDRLLTTVLMDLSDASVSNADAFGNIVAQYFANYEFNDLDVYNWTADSRYWDMYRLLQDVKDIEKYGIDNDLPNYEAVAVILRSFIMAQITDAYGDVPFSEATRAESDNLLTPRYDTQESIYDELLADLDYANGLIAGGSINGDRLFNGNMMAWKKWANSLRLRLLMRMSEVRNVATQVQALVNAPSTYPMMASNADNAIYRYSGAFPDLSPISVGRGREYSYFLSMPTTHLVNTLQSLNDPRLEAWLDPQYGTGQYIGVAPGQSLGDIGRPVNFATKDTTFYTVPNKATGVLMTYSEVAFLLAEAAERGLITADAQMHYENGVTAAMEQWGVTLPAGYFTGDAAYTGDKLEKIAIQKWLSFYHNTVEAWHDWKRTGRPSFIQAGPGTINNGLVPVRLLYPSIEQSVNQASYTEAAARMGGDNVNTRMWWAN